MSDFPTEGTEPLQEKLRARGEVSFTLERRRAGRHLAPNDRVTLLNNFSIEKAFWASYTSFNEP